MEDIVITGASRGIGAALARSMGAQSQRRVVLVARDTTRLEQVRAEIESQGGQARWVSGDLGSLAAARQLAGRLLAETSGALTLVHNAGVWPARCERGPDGLERAFVVNHLAPLAMQAPLLAQRRIRRILVVSAGLITKGRFDRERTPVGADFSSFRTYCSTKLCFAIAMRQVAADHPDVDMLVLHPGVVRTDLGARPGLIGALLALAKRGWEPPEACAARMARILALPRWSSPGKADFWFEQAPMPWPTVACDPELRRAVLEVTEGLLGEASARYAV